MTNYEYLFATMLQRKLKNKIKSRIYVEVNWHDELYIKIYRDDDNYKFETRIVHFADKLLNGLSTDYAAYEIVKQYEKFVYERMREEYFYLD